MTALEDARAALAEYERLTAPPTDDEREALAPAIWHRPEPGPLYWDWRCLRCSKPVRDHPSLWRRILKSPVSPPVTDTEVEAAARAAFEHVRGLRPADHGPYATWEENPEDYREYLRGIHRAALDAARDVRSRPDSK